MEQQSDYYDRSKAVFFVCIVYFWDHQLDRVSCVSHTCVTPDMRKRNEQVTLFIQTIFDIYNNKSKAEGYGRIKFLSLWSDNCGDQFKNKYHFGWGSGFLDNEGLLAIFFNYFAPGHGKGLCDSEGGVSKHAVALAALHGSKLISPYDLFKYLKENCLDVSSKTTSALHSPDRRDFLYFKDGEFLNFHPIDLKIDRINCFHSFTISKQNPLECIDTAFHGAYHTNILDIQVMELVPENINLGLIMRESLLSYRTSYDKAYFVMIYQNANILRPTFALISPGASFNVATVRAHILEPYDATTNYFNYTLLKVPKGGLCHQREHACPKLHTQLIRFDHICAVCLRTAPAGSIVNTAKLVPSLGTKEFYVYDLKDSYSEDVLSECKANRVNVFGNFVVRK